MASELITEAAMKLNELADTQLISKTKQLVNSERQLNVAIMRSSLVIPRPKAAGDLPQFKQNS